MTGALVLFSGGQDSATCLASALDRFDHVETIGFDYGQRHRIELECRAPLLAAFRRSFPAWAGKHGPDHLVDLGFIGAISETALTRDTAIAMEKSGLPNTFVPGRNLLFLTAAAMVAYRRGLSVVVGGMCETDFSGYPDCRNDTMRAMETALNQGMATKLTIDTPLMWLSKAETWALAERLGGAALVDLILRDTHTCYMGVRDQLHDWGYGCGTCPACALRKKGYEEFRAR